MDKALFERLTHSMAQMNEIIEGTRQPSRTFEVDAMKIKEIEARLKAGYALSDIAVLFRTNMQPRFLMEQLMSYNVDFKTRDQIPNLYDHWIARDIRTYINIARGSRARKDFLMILSSKNY